MSSMTMHGIEAQLDRRLREEAAATGLSLNQTLKKMLASAVGLNGQPVDHRKDYLEFFGSWSDDDVAAFNTATEDLNLVEPRDWQ